MFKTIEQALGQYKKNLRFELEGRNNLKKKYGQEDSPDYDQKYFIPTLNSKARMGEAAHVLGLNQHEEQDIEKEIREEIKKGVC